jgi:hypothetical protein
MVEGETQLDHEKHMDAVRRTQHGLHGCLAISIGGVPRTDLMVEREGFFRSEPVNM